MKPRSEPNPVSQHLLDLLVDGELTDDEERALLAQLEHMPNGWRQCALAFLEARCWKRGLSSWQTVSLAADNPPVAGPRRKEATHHGRRATAPRWARGLALAAVFLVALGVGSLLPVPWNASSPPLLTGPTNHEGGVEHMVARTDVPAVSDLQSPAPSTDLYLGDLTLVGDGGSRIDVPVFDWDQRVADQLMYPAEPISPDIYQHLKRHQVRSSRSYLPVRLQDGRQVVLPVQEVNITPVVGVPY